MFEKMVSIFRQKKHSVVIFIAGQGVYLNDLSLTTETTNVKSKQIHNYIFI